MKVQTGIGKVLIKPLQDNSIIKLSGQEVYIDKSWQPEKHSITCGEIVSIPTQIDDSLRTTIEVQVGDIVFFHYLSTLNAIRDWKYYIDNDEIIYSVMYQSLYCAKRNEEIIPLNGYILVKPILKHLEEKVGEVYLPESKLKEEMVSKGIVAYAGSPLKGEKQLAEVGQEIIFRKSSAVPIQFHLHDSLGEKLFRMRNDSIMATIKN